MAENEVQNDAVKDNAQEAAKDDSLKGKLSSFFSRAASLGKDAFDTVKETAVDTANRAKEKAEELKREHDADDIYRKLGKKVYKLVCRDEVSLPECCEKYIAELNELYADADSSDDCKKEDCSSDEAVVSSDEAVKSDDTKDDSANA